MTRTLTSGMQTAVAAERGYDIIHLIQMESSGGTLRIATSAQDISWSGQTWAAVGGHLQYGGSQETGDLKAQGVPVALSGVDGSIVSLVLNNFFRGYEVIVYRALLNSAAGTIVADPLEEFRGYQNTAYTVTDDQQAESMGGGSVSVKTRWVSRLAAFQQGGPVLTNLHSHRDMLRRGGLTGTDLTDAFFKFLPALVNKPIYWGTASPARVPGGGDSIYVGRGEGGRGEK